MSDREKIVQLLDEVPAYKLGYILAYVQGLTADEDADDAYCEQLYQNYLKDPDRGQTFTEDKQLKGHTGLLRLRVGSYRIIYTVDNGRLIVRIIDAGNRGQIYNRY